MIDPGRRRRARDEHRTIPRTLCRGHPTEFRSVLCLTGPSTCRTALVRARRERRMDGNETGLNVRELVVGIVSSYVANNSLRGDDLPALITAVHRALADIDGGGAEPVPEPLTKPVSAKKSVHPDYLISMEDGKRYQSLKRHLAGRGLTPAEYRAKWDLPQDYPMTAPRYSERRSALAKSLGLGRKRSAGHPGAAVENETDQARSEPATASDVPAKPRGRRKRAQDAGA